MSRVGRIATATILLAGALGIGRLALPERTYACSCAMPPSIAVAGNEPGNVVVAGVVRSAEWTAAGHLQGTFAVSRLFKGTLPGPQVPILGGGGGDCTISFEVGQALVMVARFNDGFLVPFLCAPNGDMQTAEGIRLYADAVAAYGSASSPDAGATTNDLKLAIGFLAAVSAFAAVLFVTVAVAVRRRRQA